MFGNDRKVRMGKIWLKSSDRDGALEDKRVEERESDAEQILLTYEAKQVAGLRLADLALTRSWRFHALTSRICPSPGWHQC